MKEISINHPPIDFERIWLKRWNQDIEGALLGLAYVQKQKGWEKLDTALLSSSFAEEHGELVEALLLKASLFRAQGNQTESSQLISRIYKLYNNLGRPLPFRLSFEVAIDLWLREDLNQALEFFLLAEQKATSDIQKIYCYANMLWILESFDLERAKVEKQLEEKLELLSSEYESVAIKSIREQYQAYSLRKQFLFGQLSTIELKELIESNPHLNQLKFLSLFISALPYFDKAELARTPTEVEPVFKSHLWQGTYRFRTLQGILIPSDRHLFRCSDAIDRLYLWTWLYMAGKQSVTLEKIEVTLTSIGHQIELDRLSVENRLLLRNSIKWLTLLAPRVASPFKSMLEKNFPISKNFSVLENEFLFADLITGEKSDSEFLKMPYGFPNVLEQLPVLRLCLEEIKKIKELKKGDISLLVDRATFEIRSFRSGEMVKSEILSLLFSNLAQSNRMEIKDLGEDFASDRRKVYNLVSRAKALIPNSTIRIESDQIILEDMGSLQIYLSSQNSPAISQELKETSITKGSKAGAREKLISKDAAMVVFQEGFERSEIEKSFGVSKAKACRVIAGWLEDGIIIRSGSGKSLYYYWRKS